MTTTSTSAVSATADTDQASARTVRRVEVLAFAGPDQLRVTVGPPPPPLEPGQARIRVLASSATLSDSIVRRGFNPYTSHLELPFTLGYDMVGLVEELVPQEGQVAGAAVGDLVVDLLRWGGNTDVLVRPIPGLTRVTADLDPVQLEPLVMTGVTAYQVLTRVAGVRAGQTVLVHGATGGVGLLAAELAVLLGARVVATGSPAKHGALTARGATALDGRSEDLADQVRQLAPEGVDAVLDGVGGPSRAVVAATLRHGGILVGFGFAGPAAQVAVRTPENADHPARAFAEAQAILEAVRTSGNRAEEYEVGTARDMDRAAYDHDLNALADLVATGRLHPEVRAFPLEAVAQAHTEIDAGRVTGRVVLDHRIAPPTAGPPPTTTATTAPVSGRDGVR